MPDPLADDRQAEQKIQALCRDLAVDAHLEFGPDPRHAEQRGRPRALQVGRGRCRGFQQRTLSARCKSTPVRRTSARRHGTTAGRTAAVRLVEAEQLGAAGSGKPQIGETVHHAFGHAGGAGGVNDGRQLIGGGFGVVLDRRTALQVGPAEIEVARRMQRQADGRQIRADPTGHARPIVEFADEGQRRFRMLEHLGHGFGGEVGVQRHGNMAGHPDGQVGNDPVGAVFRDQGDVTALGQFPRTQPMGGAAGLMADVGPGQCLDLSAADGLHQKALAGMTGFTFVEDVQRQTKSSRHATRSFFLVWSKRSQPSKCLVGYFIQKLCMLLASSRCEPYETQSCTARDSYRDA